MKRKKIEAADERVDTYTLRILALADMIERVKPPGPRGEGRGWRRPCRK